MSRALHVVAWLHFGFFFLVVCVALFGSPCTSSKPQRVYADFQSISSALETYRQTTGDYPTTDQGLMALVTRPETLPEERDWQSIAIKIPTDPWKNEYRYRRLPDSSARPFEIRCVGPTALKATRMIACRNDQPGPKHLSVYWTADFSPLEIP